MKYKLNASMSLFRADKTNKQNRVAFMTLFQKLKMKQF